MTELWDPQVRDNPLAFVMAVFPWGVRGSSLEKQSGPREWQKKKLLEIRDFIHQNKIKELNNLLYDIFCDATVSGRGVGKSALVAWLIWWFLSTRIGSTVIVSANTEDQLRTKTWAELGKWTPIAINSHWFETAATSLKPATWFGELVKSKLGIGTNYYYAQAQLWAEDRTDAFAGAHNPLGMMVIFDEASGIPEAIWGVSKGFFTDISPDRFWFAFGNGRRNTGAFFECFHKNRKFWRTTKIDARHVEGCDPNIYSQIIEEKGADSDSARIEVYGEFPKQGEDQFISRSIVEEALIREVEEDTFSPLMMGVDPARYGDDSTVIRFRQGRDATLILPIVMSGANNMAVANRCAELIQKYNPDAVCIDSGAGAGIIDRLIEMKYKVFEVGFGTKSDDPRWGNKRTELWDQMLSWLGGGKIDNNQFLIDDLVGPKYRYQGNTDKIILEPKEDMKARGLSSPNHGDALALTFAVKVARTDIKTSGRGKINPIANGMDFDVFGG